MNVKDIAQTVTAYLAIPALLFYPAGFLSIWLQFHNYYNLALSTAWQAASLVDRVVVMGRGATVLAVTLVVSLISSAVISYFAVTGRAFIRNRKVLVKRSLHFFGRLHRFLLF
jgi:hypothetical protein